MTPDGQRARHRDPGRLVIRPQVDTPGDVPWAIHDDRAGGRGVHATYSGFFDEVRTVQIAPDAEAERQFLPDPSALRDRLLLADRGYPRLPYFEAVREQGGSFIVRHECGLSSGPEMLKLLSEVYR